MKSMIKTKLGITLTGVLALIGATASADITLNTVIIGDPGNLADTSTGFGAVSSTYAIGTYEVSNAEYTAFLNAVDPSGTNPNAIYNTSMNSDASNGGITFTSGASIGTKYAAKAGFANKPVNYVSFLDAMRFANWLNNGQGGADTETGAYTLSLGGLAPRNGGATVFIPNRNEWNKAAFYDPVNPNADLGGTTNYWLYPTQSDSAPTAAAPNGAANQANYLTGVAVTVSGAYTGSASHYGTFDQGGNVWELTEEISGGSSRVLVGGHWNDTAGYLTGSGSTSLSPSLELASTGFRIATVPEPTSAMLLLGSGAMLLLRRRRAAV